MFAFINIYQTDFSRLFQRKMIFQQFSQNLLKYLNQFLRERDPTFKQALIFVEKTLVFAIKI